MRFVKPLMFIGASLFGLALSSLSLGNEAHLKLAADADTGLVMARCAICHSVDYIQMNAPFLKRAGWEAEVKKMIKTYGAPVGDDDAAKIIDYLTRHYGVE